MKIEFKSEFSVNIIQKPGDSDLRIRERETIVNQVRDGIYKIIR